MRSQQPSQTNVLTVKDIRAALEGLPDDAKVISFAHFGEEITYSKHDVHASPELKLFVIVPANLGPEPD